MSKKSTRLEALQNMFRENEITSVSIEHNTVLIDQIKQFAGAVPDYRNESYVRHPLGSIIMIVFFAVLADADEWGEIESFARKKEKWLRTHLDLPYGIPTDDTYRIVIGNIDIGNFFRVTTDFLIKTINGMLSVSGSDADIHQKSIVSVDGKESRGSKRKDSGEGAVKPYQTLNVYSDDYGMCIAQEFIEEKTNEIPVAQEILGIMDLRNTIVTADAMNCQKETASAVIRSGGDYVLGLKGNQPLFHSEVKEYFDQSELKELEGAVGCYKRTMEKEHSGTATREYYITEDVDWYSRKKEWKNLKSFGMVRKTVKNNDGSGYVEYRYYIGSIGSDADEFERAVRRHWGVENHIHWQLDFTFRDDKNTSMAETGGKNLQTMKKIALSILRLVKDSYRLSMKRIRYELALDYEKGIEKMLSLLDVESIEKALKSKGKSSQK